MNTKDFYNALKAAKIERLNNAPIKKDIVGEWTLVSSNNTNAYLKKLDVGEFTESTFLAANQSFSVVFMVHRVHGCLREDSRK